MEIQTIELIRLKDETEKEKELTRMALKKIEIQKIELIGLKNMKL